MPSDWTLNSDIKGTRLFVGDHLVGRIFVYTKGDEYRVYCRCYLPFGEQAENCHSSPNFYSSTDEAKRSLENYVSKWIDKAGLQWKKPFLAFR